MIVGRLEAQHTRSAPNYLVDRPTGSFSIEMSFDDTNAHAAIPAPATDHNGQQNDPQFYAHRIERIAYDALISNGGRPSHPFSLIHEAIAKPGRYRDIISFWQDRSDEWQLFNKQLSRWQIFVAHQKSSREPDKFPSYAEDLLARLHRHGFELPASFDKPSGFSRHLPRQGKLATWVEYLNYELTRRDEYQKWLENCQTSYDNAVSVLVKSGVMKPLEVPRSPYSDISRPSSIEITREKYQTQKAKAEVHDAREVINRRAQCSEYRSRQQIEEEDFRLLMAEKRLATINERTSSIYQFKHKTHAYRFALDRAERHELLLRWVLDQVPLIEQDMRLESEAGPSSYNFSRGLDNQSPPAFERFTRLPPEIRIKIWMECLPPRPTAHFFDVLNHRRSRHLTHWWSSKEFRLRPSKTHDSGYNIVYKLLATCKEARFAVHSYYGRSFGDKKSGPSTHGGGTSFRTPDFSTFDWIPLDDLIVLCFPPIQVPQLPKDNPFRPMSRLGGSPRNFGVLVPREILIMPQFTLSDDVEGIDDAAQIAFFPNFVEGLYESPPSTGSEGATTIGMTQKLHFIVDGWNVDHVKTQQLFGANSTATSLSQWSHRPLYWKFDASYTTEQLLPWNTIFPSTANVNLPEARNRQVWWLGSGTSGLGVIERNDSVERNPGMRIEELISAIQTECDLAGWSNVLDNVEALGWMEPADRQPLEQEPAQRTMSVRQLEME